MKRCNPEFTRNLVCSLLVVIVLLSRFLPRETTNSPEIMKAYLDPGTGSMIISAIVGVFATIVLGVKTFGYKLKNLFKSRSKSSDTRSNDNPPEKS